MMLEFNRQKPVIYNTVQMYRADRLDYLQSLHERAQARGFRVGVKLVRGAYMEKERLRASKLGLPSPIHVNKAATDAAFDAAVELCIKHIDDFGLFVGTHNEDSLRRLTVLMKAAGLQANDDRIEMSQLLGMSDNLTYNLAFQGYHTSKYVPYGPVASVLPYLVRRAEENSAVAGQAGRELQLIDAELRRRARKLRARL
jgi:proline dehydrogenase